MATRIQIRRDTEANWNSIDPVLAQGELGLNLNNNKIKLGNGVDSWTELEYNPFSASIDSLTDVTITSVQNGDFLRYNGSASVWINDPVNLSTDTVGDYVQNLTAGTGVTLSNNSGEGSTPTIAIGQAVGTSSSVQFAKVTAPVTGNLTGNADTATTLQTPRTISLSGDVSGSVSFNGASDVSISATVQPNSVALGTDTTGNFVNDVTAGTGVTVTHTPGEGSSPTIAIGQAVGTSASVTFAKVDTTGDVTVGGNLTVNGTTTTLNTETLSVEDNIVVLNSNATGSPALNAGLEVERGDSANVVLRWNESTDKWETTNDGSAYSVIATNGNIALGTDTTGNFVNDVTAGTGVSVTHTPGEGSSPTIAIGQAVSTSSSVTFGHVSAPVTGNVTGNLTGNADTAGTLQTPRTISLSGDVSGSVSFNGSSNVDISATIQPNSVALGTDTTGNYVNDLTGGTGVTITHTPGEGSSPTVSIGQSVATSASVTFAHVAADVTGNVTGNVTGSSGSTTGNAATATALQNARNISLTGDVSGSVSFNGTSDVSISATIQPNSVALGTDTTGNFVNDLTAGTGVTITHTPGEGSSPTVAIGQSVATSASVTFAKVDTTGDVVVGGNLTVNGTTTTLNTETLAIEDNIVILNSNVTGSPTTNAGLEVERGDSTNVAIRWNESTDKWETTTDGSAYSVIATNGNIALGTDTTGNYMSDLTQGTGVTITHTPAEGSNATIAIGQSVATTASVTFANVTADLVGNVTGNVTGNITGSSGSTTGNAATATALQTARAISLTGDVSGSVSFNGTSDVSITATVQPNSVALGTDTTGNYMSGVSAGTGISVTHTPSEGSSATIALNATLDDLSNVLVTVPISGDYLKFNGSNWVSASLDSSGITVSASTPSSPSEGDLWFDSTTLDTFIYYGSGWLQQNTPPSDVNELYDLVDVLIDAPTPGQALVYNGTEWENGVAQSALTLENARVISLSGDVSGSVSFNGSANAVISATIQPNSVALGADTTGNYVSGVSSGTGISVSHTPSEGSTATVSLDATLDNLSNVTVPSPSSGDFLKWNGTAWVSDSIDLGTDTTGNYMSGISVQNGLTVSHTPGEGSSATVGVDNALLSNFLLDGASGNSYGLIGTSAYLDVKNTNGYNKEIELDIVSVETKLTTDGYLKDSSTSASVSFARLQTSGDVVVGGNLTVNGTTTTLNTETLSIEDNIIVLNSNVSASPTLNAGIEVERGTSANVLIRWNETNDQWEFTNDGTTYGDIAALGTIELGTDTTGNYVSDLTQGTGVTITHTPGEGSNATIAIGQAVATSSSVTFANVTSTGNVEISGRIDKTTIRESVADTSVSASVVTADYATGDIFYVGTAPSSNFTVNLTNAPTDNGKAITVVIFVTQGATGYYPNVVQVAGSAQTIKWANGAAPTPTSSAGKIDIFSFTFVRRSSAWTVFGSSNLGY